MNLAQAYLNGKIDRFEMMKLAEVLADLNQKSLYASFEQIDFNSNGQFDVLQTKHIKKKEVLQYFSLLLAAVYALTNQRLASIFLNHYLACQNNTDFFKFLPKAKRKPFIMACGGLSGSGKSRVARESAPYIASPFGAIVIRDDIVRKQLVQVSFDTTLDERYYTPENERLVYKEMRRQAKQAIMAGYSVILDALFYNPKERQKAEMLALKLDVPFEAFWMDAPLSVRASRVQMRLNNPSDVKKTSELVSQLSQEVGQINWKRIDSSGNRDETLTKVLNVLKRYLR